MRGERSCKGASLFEGEKARRENPHPLKAEGAAPKCGRGDRRLAFYFEFGIRCYLNPAIWEAIAGTGCSIIFRDGDVVAIVRRGLGNCSTTERFGVIYERASCGERP